MARVMYLRYVGKKPRFTDHLYGSNLVWLGKGHIVPIADVQLVAKLLLHKDILETATEAEYNETGGLPPAVTKSTVVPPTADELAAAQAILARAGMTAAPLDPAAAQTALAQTVGAKSKPLLVEDVPVIAETEVGPTIDEVLKERGEPTVAELAAAAAQSIAEEPTVFAPKGKEEPDGDRYSEKDDGDARMHNVDLNRMTGEQLTTYAMKQFGHELDAGLKIQQKRAKVKELRIGNGVTA